MEVISTARHAPAKAAIRHHSSRSITLQVRVLSTPGIA